MKGLIEDLLAYSRATAHAEGYEEVDLNEVVDEIVSYHKEEFQQKRVGINRGNLAILKAVPFQIKQLLSNLIDNAVKYRHPDRAAVITIENELVNGHTLTEYKVDPVQQYYKVSVKDNGIGFDPQYAGKIFEIFQRLDPTAAIKGSGIGLAICKKIVQNHNGFITADGKPGEGASFHIYLPKNE
jgi:signal transduction histidine kinase